MTEIITAIGILGGLGLVFGLVLAVASKVFYVETDPRLDQLNECLPGANCGGCGYAGCGGYAEAVLKGEAEIGKCASGGNECAQKMGAIMGLEVGVVERKVAMVRCSGYKTLDAEGNVIGGRVKGDYEGIQDCLAASKVAGRGSKTCKFGCLGFGNCVRVCQYGALSIVDGIAVVDEDKCRGCMACAAVCPRQLIVPVDPAQNVIIGCASLAKGAITTRSCTVGCIGCGKCAKACTHGAIIMEKNLARIDPTKCISCGDCAKACPKGLIKDSNVENLPLL